MKSGASEIRTRLKSVMLLFVAVVLCITVGILFQKYIGIESIKSTPPVEPIYQAQEGKREAQEAGGQERLITLNTRTWNNAENRKDFETITRELSLDRCALVLIDAWEDSGEFIKQNIKQNVVHLLELARENDIHVIHALHDREAHHDCRPIEGEPVIESKEDLDEYLKEKGIDTLLYAGFATNMCVIDRPVGIINMSRLGYEIILVKDCTTAVETPESTDGEWAWRETVNTVMRLWGSTTTLEDLDKALPGPS